MVFDMATGPNIIDLGSDSESEKNNILEDSESDAKLDNSGDRDIFDLDSEGDNEDPAVTDLKQKLDGCLSSIKIGGTFAVSHNQSTLVSPGLFVDGIGEIGLPLSERDAEEIIETCDKIYQSSFRKQKMGCCSSYRGGRKDYGELDSGKFQLKNPAWETYVQKVANEVAKELGMTGGSSAIKVELCSLQIHAGEDEISKEYSPVVLKIIVCLSNNNAGLLARQGELGY